MRAPSFIIAFLLVVGQILSLTLGSPLASEGMHKRICTLSKCRIDGEPAPVAVGNWTPEPYQPSETANPASSPTPLKQQLGTDPTQGNRSVLEPSPALPFASESSSANAGVALAFQESGLFMALTGLFAIALAY